MGNWFGNVLKRPKKDLLEVKADILAVVLVVKSHVGLSSKIWALTYL